MIDSLSSTAYLNRFTHQPVMTADEELQLGRRVRAGDAAAREQFIERNLKLVVSLAGRYRARGVDFADLVHEGNLGLMRAVDKFDPEMGYRFSTYAAWWIRQSVERAIMNQAKTVRTPIHKQREIRQTQREIAAENETVPGYARKNLDHWFNPAEQIISLDQPMDGMDGSSGVDWVVSDEPSPEEHVMAGKAARDIRRWLQLLPDLPRTVLMRRYGLDGREPETLASIGERLGATRERVRQIQVDGLNHLRRLVETGVIPVEAVSFAT